MSFPPQEWRMVCPILPPTKSGELLYILSCPPLIRNGISHSSLPQEQAVLCPISQRSEEWHVLFLLRMKNGMSHFSSG